MATLAQQRPASTARIAYRRILVPVEDERGAAAVQTACSLAAEYGGTVTALAVIEVPAALPLDAQMPEEEVKERLAVAEAIGDRYGVRVERLVVRARTAGEAIVAAAEDSDAELIVLRARMQGRRFGKTARHVLLHAACRVLIARPAP